MNSGKPVKIQPISAYVTPVLVSTCRDLNPLRAKFFRGNINIYLHFISLLHIDMKQAVEILHHVRQGPTYST